jgi:hypothetical protein
MDADEVQEDGRHEPMQQAFDETVLPPGGAPRMEGMKVWDSMW